MKKLLLILSISIGYFSLINAQTISTVAGGPPINNAPATSFGMQIYGAITDKKGNLYVSDNTWSIVRKVNLTTGTATIVAGIGNFGYSGDGGQATNAGFSGVAELAIDTAGNLYIGTNARIRKVNILSGIVSTVVGNGIAGFGGDGGPATAAEINGESGISFDKNNNMYIADFLNHRVRKVDATTGIITTIAGTGVGGYNGDNITATTAKLYYPAGVCVDDTGNVYIAEQSNSRVRKINTSGIITTFAGNGSFGYAGDGGAATAAKLWCPLSVKLDKAGNLYLADWGNNRVRKVDISTGIISTVAGNGINGHSGDGGPATSAELMNSYCICFDTSYNFYIVEGFNPAFAYNTWIRKVDAVTNNISTIVGNGSSDYNGDGMPATNAQLAYPYSIATDAAGNFYITDFFNDRIRSVNTSGFIFTLAGNGDAGYKDNCSDTVAELFGPYDIKFDKSGNFYVSDYANDRVRELFTSNTTKNFAGNGLNSPYGGSLSGDNGLATKAGLYYPTGIATDDSGNVFIADMSNNRIRKVNWKTGDITTVAGNGTAGYGGDGGPATVAKLNYPSGVAVDKSDNIYIADQYNNRIREIDVATGIISTIAGTGVFGYSGDGGPAIKAKFAIPEGISIDANGVIYVADSYNNCIRSIDPVSTTINTIAGNTTLGFSGDGGPATAAELNLPSNVAFDAAGNMYIADNANNRIRKVTGVVGINEATTSHTGITVYPNPSNGKFNFSITNYQSGVKSDIVIYNELGEKTYNTTMSESVKQLDLSGQSAGVYLYRVLSEDGKLIGEGKLVIE